MLEIGKLYKLKKLMLDDNGELKSANNSNHDYEILGIRDGEFITCVDTETKEPFFFHKSVFIDPEHPEDDTFIMKSVKEQLQAVIKPHNNLSTLIEEGGCCAAASAGSAGGCGVSCGPSCNCSSTQAAIATGQSSSNETSASATAVCAPIGHIYGAMVNGKPVQGKSVGRKKKKKDKKNEIYIDGTNHIKLEFDENNALVYITIDNKDCYSVDIDKFNENISDYIYNEILNDVFEFDVNWEEHFSKLNRFLKKVNAELKEDMENYEHVVTPDEMIEYIEDTFDPYETLITYVQNHREKIKVIVNYDNPEQPALMHVLTLQFLDEITDDVLDEIVEEDLTIEDVVDRLNHLFQTHECITESYDTEEQQINLFENALELKDKFLSLTEMSPKTEAMIAYLELLETMQKNDLLEAFVKYAKAKDIEDLSLDLLESVDEQEIISSKIAQKLNSLNFVFADTKDCVYKREGNYKHLIKYDQEENKIIYKVFDKDEVVEEKSWNIKDKEDVIMIFDEISNLLEGRE